MKLTICAAGNNMIECMSNARSILENIKLRNPGRYMPPPPEPDYNPHNIPSAPLQANDWQEFKRKFVTEYGDEKIEPTGMTHSEFIHYISSSGWREGDEYKNVPVTLDLRQAVKKLQLSLSYPDSEEEETEEEKLFKKLFK